LLAYRELDDVLGLTEMAGETLAEPPKGLAEGGIYKILCDVNNGDWLVGWVPAGEVFSPPPVGTYVGEGSSFTEVKAIAEHDYKSRRCR
jgi:hypothetical protein